MGKKADYRIKNTENARDAALYVLLSVCEGKKKSHHAMREALSLCPALTKKDRALAKRIAEGTLDRLPELDCLLSRYLRKPLPLLKPVIRNILRMSFYQLLYMDKVPERAVCNEAVELAKLHGLLGLSGVVNGVLRAAVRDKETHAPRLFEIEDEATRLSIPKWLLKKYEKDFGHDGAVRIAKAYLCERPATVRFNLSKASEEEILRSLLEEGAEPERADMGAFFAAHGLSEVLKENGYDAGTAAFPRTLPVLYHLRNVTGLSGLTAFQKGFIQPQDMSSAVPAVLAAPKPGDYIIDVCAAPGGKSLQLADMLAGTGMVEARDLSPQKVALITENLARCGFSNVRTAVKDALMPDEDSFYRADIVIADLPCSGLGIAARKPDIKLNIMPYSISELRELQREILFVISKYVKPHGKLVYSTCTITPEEDEENTAYIASELGFTLLSEVKILPSETYDGFYAAVFQKEYE